MKKKKIYEGKILGLTVYDLTIRGRKVRREIIEHRGAAAMLAIDKDKKVILVKQNRFPRGNVLEIPAGTLEKGEKPIKWVTDAMKVAKNSKKLHLVYQTH